MECDLTSGEVGTPDQEGKFSQTPFGDMLDKACEYYMAIGVTYDEFWHGDYTRLKYYDRAYKLKTKMKNHELWLQGMYFYDAVSTALHNGFLKKGESVKHYAEKPYQIFELTEEEKEKEKEETIRKFREQLTAMGRRFEQKHKRE